MIVPSLARMIIREHAYRPIKGRVLCLGRQTIGMTYEQYVELLGQENVAVSDQVLKDAKLKYDNQTRVGKNTNCISDEVFFNLLGIEKFNVMDVSSYEGADILHNLNDPIPDSLEGQFDFIIDGGTFDHLLDLRTAFTNVVRMLKPGGRVFQWNAASNFAGAAYISLGPDLFYDYYSLNKFADCKVYIAAVDLGKNELWDMYEFSGDKEYSYFFSKRILMTIVMAEKGQDSSYDKIPIQTLYRDAHLMQTYKDRQKVISLSNRKPYRGTSSGIKLQKAKLLAFARTPIYKEVASKYRQHGFMWVCRKCIDRIHKYFRKEVTGFKYVGKI